jgi:hypothetical protein
LGRSLSAAHTPESRIIMDKQSATIRTLRVNGLVFITTSLFVIGYEGSWDGVSNTVPALKVRFIVV